MKRLITILLILIVGFEGKGQTDNYPNIIPPSPDAAALGKYGQYPVSLHTGVPNISIPIADLNGKELSVATSISYHGSGITVDEFASWVGLGWSLNAGGVITRTVRGRPDDDSNGFYNRTPIHASDINNYATGIWNQLEQIAYGDIDTESDFYFYNFPGGSGKFIFDDNKEILKIPFDPIQIDKSGYPQEFKITDPQGTIFRFGETETLRSGSCGLADCNQEFIFTSSWYLSEIISSDKSDTITFYYTTDSELDDYSSNHFQTIGDIYENQGSGNTVKSLNVIDPDIDQQSYRNFSTKRLQKIVSKKGKIEFIKSSRWDHPISRLAEIKVYSDVTGYKNYELRKTFKLQNNVYFSYNNGGSIPSGAPSVHRLKLNAFEEYDANNQLQKTHKFSYYENRLLPPDGDKGQDLWGYNNGYYQNNTLIPETVTIYNGFQFTVGGANRSTREEYAKACILEKIVFPTGGYTEFEYEGNKYDEFEEVETTSTASAAEMNNTTELLTQTVFITPNNTGWATLTTTSSNVTDPTPFFSEVSFKETGATNKIVDHIYDPYGYPQFDPMLVKTYNVYLTAGIQYELTAMAKGNSDSQNYGGAAFSIGTLKWNQKIPGTYKTAGGLRIKEIRSYSDANANPIIKTYKYGENEVGYGNLLVPSEFLGVFSDSKRYVLGGNDGINTCIYSETERTTFYGNTINSLSTLSGSPVVYGTVTEYIGTDSTNVGKIVHNFDVAMDKIQGVSAAYKNGMHQTNASWKGGSEIKTIFYKSDGSTKTRDLEQGFLISQNTSNKGFIAGWKSIHTGCVIPDDNAITSDFYWFDYDIYTGVKRLKSDKQITFSSDVNNLQTEVRKNYYYDNPDHWLVSRSLTLNSTGDTVETKYSYPQDYNSIENLPTLISNNIIDVPIKTEKVVNGKLIKGTAIKYNNVGKPIESHRYESAILQEALDLDKSQLVPSNYVKRVSYEYDLITKNLKNVFVENNAPQTYIWGYNGSLPIAKIDNATQSDIELVLGSGYKTGLVSLSQTQNDNLRSNAQMSDAMITSYTYDPVVGISSVMDPSGLEAFYNYDKFQRLEAIKDDNRDIIKAYEYQYKPLAELSSSLSLINITSSAQSSNINITSNVSWTISADQSWITTSPASGSDDAPVTISVTSNNSTSQRTGIVTLSESDGSGVPDEQISIYQDALVPTLTVSTTELFFDGSNTEIFTISSNADWYILVTYYDDNGWLTITPITGTGNATISVTSSNAIANNWEAEIEISVGGIYRYIQVVKYY